MVTRQYLSDAFDTLLNSYSRQMFFGRDSSLTDIVLDEYEKSLFLTQAQEDYILSLYAGRNSTGKGFEETEEMRRNLSALVAEDTISPDPSAESPTGVNDSSLFFTLPDGSTEGKPAVWFITYEAIRGAKNKCGEDFEVEVKPVRQDEYHRIKNNPFRGFTGRRALRLDLSDNKVEIVYPKHKDTSAVTYYVRYLRKPAPILLVDLEGDQNIEDETTATTTFELPDSVYQKILELAVMKALQSKMIGRQSNDKENN